MTVFVVYDDGCIVLPRTVFRWLLVVESLGTVEIRECWVCVKDLSVISSVVANVRDFVTDCELSTTELDLSSVDDDAVSV